MYKFIQNVGKKVNTIAKSSLSKRTLMLALVVMVGVGATFAQTGIVGSLESMADNFKSYVDPTRKIVYAIAAICAVIGAFTIYFKMTNGDQDVKKTIMLTVGGCAGLVALATALPAIFA